MIKVINNKNKDILELGDVVKNDDGDYFLISNKDGDYFFLNLKTYRGSAMTFETLEDMSEGLNDSDVVYKKSELHLID